MSPVFIIFCEQKCFTREDVFNDHNSRLWALDNHHAISKCGWRHFQRQCLDWYRRGHCREPLSATGYAHCSTISWSYWNWSIGDAWRCASNCETEVLVWARRSSNPLRGRCVAVAWHDLSRKVNLTWKADCVASSVAGSNSNRFFTLGISEGARLCSSF
jgi:hypothetical protein